MSTTTPGLDHVQDRLRTAARERRASLLVLGAVGIEVQRMQADVRAGRAREDDLIRDAGVLLGAALSTPYRPRQENRDVRNSSFL
ncbi:hypothetical protein NS228_05015 [Methylobacterium indicum]|uniref:hypothetical protein n=1 Tax=Methylobacterium indicum TaxID=1775910 RepID=UPI0007347CF7|nr:hypothetical protein [Methylobacterium indicum]KTS39505.1 hypothetical protein NS229_00050 [Methylobacterium indicum]KTS41747.1 hypothetical protein NS228_05015 [Methylobacterium indicum]KTS53515.1 hypothetical protein NS230_05440 [Methylobacterium indicum]